ncbi:uncharacterized protein LOC131270716 [Anopheles coustani]|uniref:uncharacterized protein LOC131269844 n=1 Tax=Anopheles coustani TaxID=139045 RepID=UPI00265812CB|nr:uncharacterized protein LOC131269844 [Anopheles coustani]XP_058128453.1 uncharacterized protein LOC131270716 [Anopheles coustani]
MQLMSLRILSTSNAKQELRLVAIQPDFGLVRLVIRRKNYTSGCIRCHMKELMTVFSKRTAFLQMYAFVVLEVRLCRISAASASVLFVLYFSHNEGVCINL